MVKKGTHRIGNYPQPKYKYLNGDTKHPYEFKECPTCGVKQWLQKRRTYCSYKCGKWGELNPQWKHDNANYMSQHARVYRRRGMASEYPCSLCFGEAREWAYIHDTDKFDEYNYMPLCKSCHGLYDTSPWEFCKQGHPLTEDNIYKHIRGGRSCKKCGQERSRLYKDKVT